MICVMYIHIVYVRVCVCVCVCVTHEFGDEVVGLQQVSDVRDALPVQTIVVKVKFFNARIVLKRLRTVLTRSISQTSFNESPNTHQPLSVIQG